MTAAMIAAMTRSVRGATFAAALVVAAAPGCARRAPFEQTYLAARHNWVFRRDYPEADRLFNAFDFGHATLYETLLASPSEWARRLEEQEFGHVTRDVLQHPPAVPLDEHAIAPRYTTLAPELEATFAWAHMLHRQLYDIIADPRIDEAARDARVGEVLRYYRSRPDLALSEAPKSMALMEGQPYSLAFRRGAPKYNGLLWSYHWLQMVLYDDLLASDNACARHARIGRSIAHFHEMLNGAPSTTPSVMPMSATVAPRFSTRYPEAAIIFDNLHSLHDVVSDVLASPLIPRREKRAALLAAAAAYRDSTTASTSREEWLAMSNAMGADAMGGTGPGDARPATTACQGR